MSVMLARNDPRWQRYFWRKFQKAAWHECWPWLRATIHTGYGAIGYEDEGRQTTLRAHRVSYYLHIGPIPHGMHVLHRCDNPSCVNPAHLYLGSHADNMRDKVARGRSRNCKTRLSAGDVLAIVTSREPLKKIALQFGISPRTVAGIRGGETRRKLRQSALAEAA